MGFSLSAKRLSPFLSGIGDCRTKSEYFVRISSTNSLGISVSKETPSIVRNSHSSLDRASKTFSSSESGEVQSLILNIAEKGLMVMTGCGHAGIVNTVRYAQKLTGIVKIHAIIGGFPASWPPDDKNPEGGIEIDRKLDVQYRRGNKWKAGKPQMKQELFVLTPF